MITDGEKTTHIAFDQLLVAVGRAPNTGDMGLESAGVVLDDHGFVVVDPMLRTSNKRIWAAGDLTGHPQFTHAAGVHGSLAASNAVLGLRRRVDLRAMPRVTFTDPEVASVGATTEPADLADGLRQITRNHRDVDRAVTDGNIDGFARLAVDGRGRVVGATLVGPRAGETLPELTLAVRKRLRTRDLAATIHAYPTYADGPWKATIADVQARLSSPRTRRATRLLGALARRRVG
jgi:pyruvate/2-oxoglutarate dehydrogenase complex dihydrolipoamide dehydrogenase (E3) component